jgi:hypothetical protein
MPMSINMSNGKNIPNDTDAYYEAVASQEEIYLEETEERLRAILISEDPSTYAQQEAVCVDCCFKAEILDEELCRAAEQLITGDSDDPPLSEEAVVDMLRVSRLYSSRSL